MALRYPIGIQSFEKIRRSGAVYIDKTAQIYELTHSVLYHFLSRPRRFGKSLLISTIEAYFKGQKELFEGLAIAALEKEWLEYIKNNKEFIKKNGKRSSRNQEPIRAGA